jgi:hypothetical protein
MNRGVRTRCVADSHNSHGPRLFTAPGPVTLKSCRRLALLFCTSPSSTCGRGENCKLDDCPLSAFTVGGCAWRIEVCKRQRLGGREFPDHFLRKSLAWRYALLHNPSVADISHGATSSRALPPQLNDLHHMHRTSDTMSGSRKARQAATWLASLCIFAALASTAEASILQVDVTSAGDMFAQLEQDGASSASTTSSSSSSSGRPPYEHPGVPAEEVPAHAYNLEAPGTPGSNGPTSTTTSSSGGSSGGSLPFMASAALCLDQDPLVMRLAERQSLSLPSPPALDLLRPPQGLET